MAADTSDFSWRDGNRIVLFREGALANAHALLAEQGWTGYEVITTARALADAPPGLRSVGAVHEIGLGGVPELAAGLVGLVRTGEVVALGGGRVIDTAKAVVAVQGGRVCAIPTTLSGAEMTAIHRLPAGHEGHALVRPVLVLADPQAMASGPEPLLLASAMNALAHGAEALYTPFANPVASMAALRGAELIAEALDSGAEPRPLALGSLLCAYAIDSALFGVHHVLSQTVVRVCGTPHAETNATLLPRVMDWMRVPAPDAIGAVAKALGTDPASIGARIEQLGGGPRRLSELGADRAKLDEAVAVASQRAELGFTPGRPGPEELRGILEAAW